MNRYFCIVLACVIIGMSLTAKASAGKADTSQKVELLWPKGAPGAKGSEDGDKPTLTIYLPPK
ncbi:MAG: alpha/beta hydrolase, partial [Phycisphaerae bacterium]|nr:alpha/beta hydrolase [Phycisphaerae bacterium]